MTAIFPFIAKFQNFTFCFCADSFDSFSHSFQIGMAAVSGELNTIQLTFVSLTTFILEPFNSSIRLEHQSL
jgi:hypothetical protein